MKKIFFLLSIIGCFYLQGSAQLVSFNFTGKGSCPSQMNIAEQPLHALVTSFRGSKVSCAPTDGHYSSTGWITSVHDSTRYIEVVLSAQPRYKLNITGVSFSQSRNSTGPANGKIAHNGTGTFSTAQNFALNTSSGVTSFSFVATEGQLGLLTFRIYGWGAADNTGILSINDFKIFGNVSLIN